MMNWIGGAKRQLRQREDLAKQRDFFARKRLRDLNPNAEIFNDDGPAKKSFMLENIKNSLFGDAAADQAQSQGGPRIQSPLLARALNEKLLPQIHPRSVQNGEDSSPRHFTLDFDTHHSLQTLGHAYDPYLNQDDYPAEVTNLDCSSGHLKENVPPHLRGCSKKLDHRQSLDLVFLNGPVNDQPASARSQTDASALEGLEFVELIREFDDSKQGSTPKRSSKRHKKSTKPKDGARHERRKRRKPPVGKQVKNDGEDEHWQPQTPRGTDKGTRVFPIKQMESEENQDSSSVHSAYSTFQRMQDVETVVSTVETKPEFGIFDNLGYIESLYAAERSPERATSSSLLRTPTSCNRDADFSRIQKGFKELEQNFHSEPVLPRNNDGWSVFLGTPTVSMLAPTASPSSQSFVPSLFHIPVVHNKKYFNAKNNRRQSDFRAVSQVIRNLDVEAPDIPEDNHDEDEDKDEEFLIPRKLETAMSITADAASDACLSEFSSDFMSIMTGFTAGRKRFVDSVVEHGTFSEIFGATAPLNKRASNVVEFEDYLSQTGKENNRPFSVMAAGFQGGNQEHDEQSPDRSLEAEDSLMDTCGQIKFTMIPSGSPKLAGNASTSVEKPETLKTITLMRRISQLEASKTAFHERLGRLERLLHLKPVSKH